MSAIQASKGPSSSAVQSSPLHSSGPPRRPFPNKTIFQCRRRLQLHSFSSMYAMRSHVKIHTTPSHARHTCPCWGLLLSSSPPSLMHAVLCEPWTVNRENAVCVEETRKDIAAERSRSFDATIIGEIQVKCQMLVHWSRRRALFILNWRPTLL